MVSFDCITGPSEIIENGENGFLIPCYDKDLMSYKINELINNDEMRLTFSKNALKNLDAFKKENITAQWINLIAVSYTHLLCTY